MERDGRVHVELLEPDVARITVERTFSRPERRRPPLDTWWFEIALPEYSVIESFEVESGTGWRAGRLEDIHDDSTEDLSGNRGDATRALLSANSEVEISDLRVPTHRDHEFRRIVISRSDAS